MASRVAEVEALRRVWTDQTGNPDTPISVVVARRKLRERD
jgi:hypothetical protein